MTREFNFEENEKKKERLQVSKMQNNLNNEDNLDQANMFSSKYKEEHFPDSAHLNPIEVNEKQAENEAIENQDHTLKLLSEIIKEPTKLEENTLGTDKIYHDNK